MQVAKGKEKPDLVVISLKKGAKNSLQATEKKNFNVFLIVRLTLKLESLLHSVVGCTDVDAACTSVIVRLSLVRVRDRGRGRVRDRGRVRERESGKSNTQDRQWMRRR